MKVTCLVTIHGVGFQQAPDDGIAGYADPLHERLSGHLDASWLGDDPNRERDRRGQAGPIYVQSHWPPRSRKTEPGLARLGTWVSRADGSIDISAAPLGNGRARIAHVALVYSHLENQGPRVGASLEATAQALVSHAHYTSVAGLARTMFQDTFAALRHGATAAAALPSLQARRPAATGDGGLFPSLPDLSASAAASGGSAWGVATAVADDVTTYVCRNELRVRVQDFVREALLRLCCRDDVEAIVVNAHSQGTVLAFDVLRGMPVYLAPTVRAFVTAGSPLRKLVDLFTWGTELGSLQAAGPWTNLWDPNDRIADPLAPPADWRPGMDAVGPWPNGGLFQKIDGVTGESTPASISDHQVDNLANSPAGALQAHDYWDNDADVVSWLAAILRQAAGPDEALPSSAPADVQAAAAADTYTYTDGWVPVLATERPLVAAVATPEDIPTTSSPPATDGALSPAQHAPDALPSAVEPADADETVAPAAAQASPAEAPSDAVPFGLVRTWAGFRPLGGWTGGPH